MEISGTRLDVAALRNLRGRFRSEITPRHLDIIANRGLFREAIHVPGDLHVEGDLVFAAARVQVLVVSGDLRVDGRLEDRDDEEHESLILVGGDLVVGDLITFGTLEVHGDVTARGHVVLLHNACITHIEGNLTAAFVLDEYHHCKVGGAVRAPLVLEDARGRIAASNQFASHQFDTSLVGVLDRELLETLEDDGEPLGLYVDSIHVGEIVDRIRNRKSIFPGAG
jgi:hypothetical protein